MRYCTGRVERLVDVLMLPGYKFCRLIFIIQYTVLLVLCMIYDSA
jgi:hypothetical protein